MPNFRKPNYEPPHGPIRPPSGPSPEHQAAQEWLNTATDEQLAKAHAEHHHIYEAGGGWRGGYIFGVGYPPHPDEGVGAYKKFRQRQLDDQLADTYRPPQFYSSPARRNMARVQESITERRSSMGSSPVDRIRGHFQDRRDLNAANKKLREEQGMKKRGEEIKNNVW